RAPAPSSAAVRGTVERSLTFLEKQGVWWINEKKCTSCHRVGMLNWTFAAAEQRGLKIDREKLGKWLDWSFDESLQQKEKKVVGAGNLEGLSQLVLLPQPISPAGAAAEKRRNDLAALIDLMVAGQRGDGSWGAGGQLPGQKRPAAET